MAQAAAMFALLLWPLGSADWHAVEAQTFSDLPDWAQVRHRTPRRALVVGVGRYHSLPSLPTPVHDAMSAAGKLRELGFSVTHAGDPTRDQFLRFLDLYLKSLSEGEIAVVYYSGHGAERNGINYLLPADVQQLEPGREGHVAISVDFILHELEKRKVALAVVMLDACRNDPLPPDSPAEATLVQPKGLAPVKVSTTGMFVGFAAAPRTASWTGFASDPPGTPSVFTRYLVQFLLEEGRSLYWIWYRVGEKVFQATSQQQRPWQNASLFPEFKLKPHANDIVEWEKAWVELISYSSPLTLATDLESYGRMFPDSPFAMTARLKLRELRAAGDAQPSVHPPPDKTRETLVQLEMQTRQLEGAVTSASFVSELADFNTVITAGTVEVRERASGSSRIVTTLPEGSRVEALALPTPNEWLPVRLESGRSGFLRGVTISGTLAAAPAAKVEFDPGKTVASAANLQLLAPLVENTKATGGWVALDVSPSGGELPDRAATEAYLRAIHLRSALVKLGLPAERIQLRLLTRNPSARDVANVFVAQ